MFKKTFSIWITRYLRYFARLQLRKNKQAIVVGVTGSSGKTSTRLAIARILRHRGTVKQTTHANSQTGIALNILGLSPRSYSKLDWLRLIILAPIRYLTFSEHYDFYVVEYGIDGPTEPNNMTTLLKILKPNIAVVLGVGLSHTASFDAVVKDTLPLRRRDKLLHAIAKEKMLLAKSVGKHGVVVLNIDQPLLVKEKRDISSRIITFGKTAQADMKILSPNHFHYLGQDYVLKTTQSFPDLFSYSFAASLAVAASLGIPPSIAVQELSGYRSPKGRLQLFDGIKGTTLIDSTYNASPTNLLDCLKYLKQIAGRKYKLAVIGDMNEQGSNAKLAHKELAQWIMQYSSEAILFGQETLLYTYPLLKSAGFPVQHFATMQELIASLRIHLHKDSFVLVKGSQNGLFMERVVQALLVNDSDKSSLPRRGPFWDKIRAKTP